MSIHFRLSIWDGDGELNFLPTFTDPTVIFGQLGFVLERVVSEGGLPFIGRRGTG
jgi:hypothetical protein